MTIEEAAKSALERFAVELAAGEEVEFSSVLAYLAGKGMQRNVTRVLEYMQELEPRLFVSPGGDVRIPAPGTDVPVTARVQLMVPLCFDIQTTASNSRTRRDWIKLVEDHITRLSDDGSLAVPVLGQHALVWTSDNLSTLQVLDVQETKPDIATVKQIQHYRVKASITDFAQRPEIPVWDHPDVEFIDSDAVQQESTD